MAFAHLGETTRICLRSRICKHDNNGILTLFHGVCNINPIDSVLIIHLSNRDFINTIHSETRSILQNFSYRINSITMQPRYATGEIIVNCKGAGIGPSISSYPFIPRTSILTNLNTRNRCSDNTGLQGFQLASNLYGSLQEHFLK